MIKQQPSIWRFHSSGHSLTFYRAESLEEVEYKAVAGNLLPSSMKKVRERGKESINQQGSHRKRIVA